MKQSKLFGKTIKEIPRDISLKNHELLYRGGFIRESVAGRYYFLPLGMRVHEKIMKITEEEMEKAGAQKILTPTLHPLELWKETNRTSTAGFELMTVKDRRGADFALGGTAEEMIVDMVRKFNISYKDLPFNVYQFSNKFRDELRARGGLLRVREFIMKDAYSFHSNKEGFEKEYKVMWDTYSTIFERCGLKTYAVQQIMAILEENIVTSLLPNQKLESQISSFRKTENILLMKMWLNLIMKMLILRRK
jgi:prolyl-tRNA synthetase